MAARAHRLYRGVNFICLTEFNARKLKEINGGGRKIIDKKRIFVKPNFIPDSKASDESSEIQTTLSKSGKEFVYAGRIDRVKGLDTILEAWKKVDPDRRLSICGSGPDEEWCRNYIVDNSLQEKVDFKGSLAHNELMALLTKADAMLFMSKWYEGFPMTIIEAFTVGTPVIGLDLGNGGDIIAGIYGSRKPLLPFDDNLPQLLSEAINGFNADNYRFDPEKLAAFREEENYRRLMEIYSVGT